MSEAENPRGQGSKGPDFSSVTSWLKGLLTRKPEEVDEKNLREALEEYLEILSEQAEGESAATTRQERELLSNVLDLRGTCVADIMIPRADITALDIAAPAGEFLKILTETHYSRIPVYRETLDDIVGIVHIKDVFASLAAGKPVVIPDVVREAPIISPSLPVIDALLMMQKNRQHLLFVVDEYGGIDGLVTIGDIASAIIGEVQGEYEKADAPLIREDGESAIIAEGRTPLSTLEDRLGPVFSEDEREMADTIGGLVFTLAGRVPAKGEIFRHEGAGLGFEILASSKQTVDRVRVLRLQGDREGE